MAQAGGSDALEELAAYPWAVLALLLYTILIMLGFVFAFGIFQKLKTRRFPWRSYVMWLEERPWGLREIWFLAAVLISVHLAVALGLQLFVTKDFEHSKGGQNLMVILGSLAFHWTAFGTVLLLVARKKWSWPFAFGIRVREWRPDLIRGGRYYLSVLPMIMLVALLYHAWTYLTGEEVAVQDAVDMIMGTESVTMLIYLGVLAVVVAPVVEEIVFRGMLFPWLARVINLRIAILVVSVAFGLIHGFSGAMLPLMALSVMLCLAYVRTQSLFVPIVMHALFNGVNLFVMLATRDLVL